MKEKFYRLSDTKFVYFSIFLFFLSNYPLGLQLFDEDALRFNRLRENLNGRGLRVKSGSVNKFKMRSGRTVTSIYGGGGNFVLDDTQEHEAVKALLAAKH